MLIFWVCARRWNINCSACGHLLKISCVTKIIVDFSKEFFISQSVICIIYSMVLNKMHVTMPALLFKIVIHYCCVLLSFDICSCVLINWSHKKTNGIKSSPIGGKAKHISVRMIIRIWKSTPHLQKLILIAQICENSHKHNIFPLSDCSPIKYMICDVLSSIYKIPTKVFSLDNHVDLLWNFGWSVSLNIILFPILWTAVSLVAVDWTCIHTIYIILLEESINNNDLILSFRLQSYNNVGCILKNSRFEVIRYWFLRL